MSDRRRHCYCHPSTQEQRAACGSKSFPALDTSYILKMSRRRSPPREVSHELLHTLYRTFKTQAHLRCITLNQSSIKSTFDHIHKTLIHYWTRTSTMLRNHHDTSRQPQRSASYKIEADQARAASNPTPFQETYSIYNLQWSKLRRWLQVKFPGCKFDDKEKASPILGRWSRVMN